MRRKYAGEVRSTLICKVNAGVQSTCSGRNIHSGTSCDRSSQSDLLCQSLRQPLPMPCSYFACLNEEILTHILSHTGLCIRDKLRCGQVCASWRRHLWQPRSGETTSIWGPHLRVSIGFPSDLNDGDDDQVLADLSAAAELEEVSEQAPPCNVRRYESGSAPQLYVNAWAGTSLAYGTGYIAWLKQAASGIEKISLHIYEDPTRWHFADFAAALQAAGKGSPLSTNLHIKVKGAKRSSKTLCQSKACPVCPHLLQLFSKVLQVMVFTCSFGLTDSCVLLCISVLPALCTSTVMSLLSRASPV